MKHAVVTGAVVPLFCCSSDLTYGTRTLLKEIVELLPSAADSPVPPGRVASPAPGRVFKTVSEPHVGDVTYFRLYRGEMQNGEEVWNAEHGVIEKINHLSIPQGKDRVEVERLMAGDIGCVAKLKDTHTGDTFCRRDPPVRLPPIEFPEAVATSACW